MSHLNIKKMLIGVGVFVPMMWIIAGCSSGPADAPPVAPTSVSLTAEKYVVSCTLFDEDQVPDNDAYLVPGTITAKATDKNGAAVKLFSDSTGGTRIDGTPQATTGLLTFYVDSGAALPITVTVSGSAPPAAGYVPNNKVITIDAPGSYSVLVGLIDENSPPTSSTQTVSIRTTADTNGKTLETVTASVVPTSPVKSAAQVSIPSSTVLKSAGGATLTGNLKVSLTSVPAAATSNNNQVSQLAGFPGGLGTVILAAPPTGTTSTIGAMETAGFVRVHITDAAGNVAKTLSNPLTIRIDILAGTNNPATNLPIQAGDTLPIWTYDELAQQWSPFEDANAVTKQQLIATAKSDRAGLYVEFTSTHLSYFAMASFTNNCSVAVSDNNLNLYNINFKGLNFVNSCMPTSSTQCTATISPTILTILGLLNIPITMEVTLKKDGSLVNSSTYSKSSSLCSSGINPLPFKQSTTSKVTINARNVCPSDHNKTSPIYSQEVRLFTNNGSVATPIRASYQFSAVTANTTGSASFQSFINDNYVAQVTKRGTTSVKEVPISVKGAVTTNIDFDDQTICPPTGSTGGTLP